jgi:sporulation protein YlmC with PRC-barrel domain
MRSGTAVRARAQLALALLLALALPLAAQADAVAAGTLIGRPIQDLRGGAAGTVEDLIVDVRDGRVVYVIVDARERYITLPIRALHELNGRVWLDTGDAGEMARTDEPRLRRAARLIGQPLENPGDGRIGTIADIVFDPARGRVERVVVAMDDGKANFPPSVLAHGRFPPLTRWQAEHPPADFSGDPGYLRREPTDERKRLHEHRWPRH